MIYEPTQDKPYNKSCVTSTVLVYPSLDSPEVSKGICDQRRLRLIWVFAGSTSLIVGFVVRLLTFQVGLQTHFGLLEFELLRVYCNGMSTHSCPLCVYVHFITCLLSRKTVGSMAKIVHPDQMLFSASTDEKGPAYVLLMSTHIYFCGERRKNGIFYSLEMCKLSLRKHPYSNILKISPPKAEIYQIKILILFIFLLKT